jgi:hypothetical protein
MKTVQERLDELNLSDEEFEAFIGMLPAFPHGKGTDIEAGIFVKPTDEELEEIGHYTLDRYLEERNVTQ